MQPLVLIIVVLVLVLVVIALAAEPYLSRVVAVLTAIFLFLGIIGILRYLGLV
jgi:hypothetical protein